MAPAREQLVAVAETLRTLEEVVGWLGPAGYALVDVVTQDEYTHDVIVAAGASFLVFDTT